MLGYALTRAAKAASYEELLSTRILQPLNMSSTSSDPKKFTARLAQPYDASGQPTPAWDLPIAHAGAGAMRSTAGDMGRYAEAISGLKSSALTKAIGVATKMREKGPGRINPIGLAWMSVPFSNRQFLNHDGGTFGSSSSLVVDPASTEGVFVVVNSSVKLTDIAQHLMDNRHSLAEREYPKTVAVGAGQLAGYAGVYKLNEEMNIQVRVTGEKITAQATRQGEFQIFPENETRFFAKVANIVMTFGDITDGRAGSFVLEQGGSKLTARRIP